MSSEDDLYPPFSGDPAAYVEAKRLLEPKPKPAMPWWERRAQELREQARTVQEQELAVVHGEWVERGFSDIERDDWIGAGLRGREAQTAEQCRTWGITPAMLTMTVQGHSALHWLRSGDSVTQVLARLREAGVDVA